MKKLLLAIFAVTSVGFAADRVVTITPSVEASGMLRPNKNNTFVEKNWIRCEEFLYNTNCWFIS